ncbi:hypothetical protein DERP_002273 [Dermatophagoides pteronyssinus]|uniref:Uncharacterized protein n=1 Tax=Dermatophagoides pteronyssinus TaxID=6956 RepID=A0ABQ8JHT3_DERPT|nr:hypothetical protein DERP_002273 [Dermatophagoides pteronyssinus]
MATILWFLWINEWIPMNFLHVLHLFNPLFMFNFDPINQFFSQINHAIPVYILYSASILGYI